MNIPEMTDAEAMRIHACVLDANHEATFSDYARAILAARDAQYAAMAGQEPVARIVSSGPHDFPLLEWLSADHSFRAPIGSMLYAAPAAQEPVPADCDVRKILLEIVPGDGDGFEVFAKNVADVEAKLCDLGGRLEDWELGIRRLPAAQERAEPVVPAVQKGWKLVPVEPTSNMLAAMSGEWHSSRHGKAREQYAALLSATPPAPAQPKGDDVDRLLHEVFLLCEATEDAPEVEPKNEHQRGFDKGRRFEAKGIRKAIGAWVQDEFCGRTFMGEPAQPAPQNDPAWKALRPHEQQAVREGAAQPSPEPSKPEQAEAPSDLHKKCPSCQGREMVQDTGGNIWPCPRGCTPANADEAVCPACVGRWCTARSGCVSVSNPPEEGCSVINAGERNIADFVQCQECERLDPDATCPLCPGWLKTLNEQQIEDCFQEAAGADEETHLRFAHAVIDKFCELNRLPPFATLPPASAAGDSGAGERENLLSEALTLALDYWRDRQQRYKNRHPVWVEKARAALATKPQAEQEAAKKGGV